MQSLQSHLPIYQKRRRIIDAVRKNRVVIVSGETGSGKTTQIPQYLLRAGRGESGMIGCTQPRRIAAVNVASRIAEELGEKVGESVGYKIRFDNRSYQTGRIKIMTDGILLAEAQSDPLLEMYDTIIVDEAHERSLNIDFILGILRQLVTKRDDLKIVITSATIDTEKFSKAFDNAPVIEVSGRMYPVELKYMPLETDDTAREESNDNDYVEAAAEAVDHILRTSSEGDILVFMPTEQDIGETMELIRAREHKGAEVIPLFARLPAKDQQKVFSRKIGRKIVVATNVAETSITIPGIKYVVDTGLARIPSYSPRTRTTALPVRKISQSSADQRMGRCGRVRNGVCIRLYSEDDFCSRPYFTSPEILRSNLAEVILRMIALKLNEISSFPFVDPPDPKSVRDGFETLLELGAIREKSVNGKKRRKKIYELTQTGRIMARIPVDPKLSRVLIEADRRTCLREAAVIVSALSIADPRQRPMEKEQQADQKHAAFKDPASDFVSYLNIWKQYQNAKKRLKSRSKLRKFCSGSFLSFKRMREWEDILRQITLVLDEHLFPRGKKRGRRAKEGEPEMYPSSATDIYTGTKGLKSKAYEIGGPAYIQLHKSLLSGYLSHIACKKEQNIYQAAKGQQAMIFPGSGLFKKASSWILAAEFVQTSQLFARTVANIDPAWIEDVAQSLCSYSYSYPHYEKKRGEVVAKEQVSLFGLVIADNRTVSYGKINPADACDIFIRKVLVERETDRKFEFMDHNDALIKEVRGLEDKTRKRGIMVTDDDIFLFYKTRIEKDICNLRTFEKYLKDRAQSFLKMTKADLVKRLPDEYELTGFPDKITMGSGEFRLEYSFSPGTRQDGVTVKVPAGRAAAADPAAVEKLVPGLFEEKIAALIKNLPKSKRKKLVPVHEKAKIISDEMPRSDKPLFSLLSSFVKQRFHVDIPASEWSEENLPPHLKMRISIRDGADREISSSRSKSIIKEFSDSGKAEGDHFQREKEKYERENITAWDFGDIVDPVWIRQADGTSCKLYPGLSEEGKRVALRLYKSYDAFLTAHPRGVKALYLNCFSEEINALKRDFTLSPAARKFAKRFMDSKTFKEQMFRNMTRALFSRDVRTKKAFDDRAERVLPQLYNRGQAFIRSVTELLEAYHETLDSLQTLARKCVRKPQTRELVKNLKKDLVSLVPSNFLDLYSQTTIRHLHIYVEAIRIRAQRAFNDPLKDSRKALKIKKYQAYLDSAVESLTADSTPEKAGKVEHFFWMLEAYKVSVFAPELKTDIKASSRKLDDLMQKITVLI